MVKDHRASPVKLARYLDGLKVMEGEGCSRAGAVEAPRPGWIIGKNSIACFGTEAL